MKRLNAVWRVEKKRSSSLEDYIKNHPEEERFLLMSNVEKLYYAEWSKEFKHLYVIDSGLEEFFDSPHYIEASKFEDLIYAWYPLE